MSLKDKFSDLKASYTNTFETDIKNKKSLIYDDGASLSRQDTFLQCREGFDNLCSLDKKFLKFDNLFLEKDIDIPIMLLKEEEIKEIQHNIRHLLFLLTDYLEVNCALKSIEWLIFKYEAHLHQPEDLLISCLPLYKRPVFVKFLRLLDLKKKEFSWLQKISESGRVSSIAELSALCIKYPNVSEMICGWPSTIIDICGNDSKAGIKMCHLVFCLSVNVLDKVNLKGSEKIEKYMSSYARFINDGLSSSINYFMSTSATVLMYMSNNIDIDKAFLRDCIKKMLKSDILDPYVCLRTVINIIASQEKFMICDKLDGLIRLKLNNLEVSNKRKIEELLSEINFDNTDFMECQDSNVKLQECDTNMECQEISLKAKQMKHSALVGDILNTFCIDWTDAEIEDRLIELLSTHVLTWYNDNNSKTSSRLAVEAVAMIRGKPKDLHIAYKRGGIIPYLCAALMSPNADLRRSVKKLISKLVVNWTHMSAIAEIKKGVLANDYTSLMFSEVGKIFISEIDAICGKCASKTVQKLALTMINTNTALILPSLTNLWSLFLTGLCPTTNITFINELATNALFAMKQSFNELKTTEQKAILDALTDGLSGDRELLTKIITTLSKIPLSLDNFNYLFRDMIGVNTKTNKSKLKKFDANSVDTSDECLQGNGKYRIIVTLGAITAYTNLSTKDKMQLIHPLCVIIEKILMSTFKDSNKEDTIYLLSNLMSAMSAILPSDEACLDDATKDFLTPKVSIEDITKCLYIFNDINLHNLILMVIQKFVKLELGLEQFPLIYFMNWLGKNIVPRDDQHSMKILNSVLELILPISIKMRRTSDDTINDNVKIIASFVKDCAGLPKHRSLLLYNILIKNLSKEKTCADNVLWIQLIYMIVNKFNEPNQSANESLILPLLKKFSKEEQLQAIKKVVMFLTQIISDPSKKRKFLQEEVSDSPRQKKRKVAGQSKITEERSETSGNETVKEFASLKEHLLVNDKKLDCPSLLKTMMTYFLIQLKESQFDMCDVTSDILRNLISNLFSSMKVISNTKQTLLDSQHKNEITVMIREIIESIGMSLPRNNYLELIVNLARDDYDESVKMKALELLSNKLAIMAKEKKFGQVDGELLSIAAIILSMCRETVSSSKLTSFWEHSVSCATSLVSFGFLDQDEVKELCNDIYSSLLDKIDIELNNLTAEKVVLLNVFLQKYVTADNGNDLTKVFKTSLKVIENCLSKNKFNNGELESSLALIHAILSREDSEQIGWDLFEQLCMDVFELTSLEFVLRKLSNASLIYQKNIRIKLSKMHDSNALINACTRLIEVGKEKNNLTFISGSISLLGCHLNVLNKRGKKWSVMEHETSNLWNIVYQMMSIREQCDGAQDKKEDMKVCEEISYKALNQLCYLFEFDQEMLLKITNWGQRCDSTVTPSVYLRRNATVYRLLHHIATHTKDSEKTIGFINQSNTIGFASALLQHIVGDKLKKKSKKRKAENGGGSVFGFSKEQFTDECRLETTELVQSICGALHGHFSAEYKCNMNLVVSDETTALITNVCHSLTTMDSYVLSKDDFITTADNFVIPLIVQLVINSFNDDTLLTPVCMGLCKYFTESSNNVHLAVLKVLSQIKEALGASFDLNIRDKVSSFLEDCKLHDDETIADLANDI